MRAVRGSRSQVAWSRRLGYRSNVAAEWEGGRRSPSAVELVRACHRAGIGLTAAVEGFHPSAAREWSDDAIYRWLDTLRGSTSQSELARRSGFSRHQVRRWLSGEAVPRVPDFLHLLDVISARAADWVGGLVDISSVPTLVPRHARARAAKRLAYERPWTAAVLMAIECDTLDDTTAARWAIPQEELDAAVRDLATAGLIAKRKGRWRVVASLTADVRATDEDSRRLKAHWASVAADRVARGGDDLFSFNLMAVSREDLAKIRVLQRSMYREIRSIVAASSSEAAALVAFHLIEF